MFGSNPNKGSVWLNAGTKQTRTNKKRRKGTPGGREAGRTDLVYQDLQ